MASAFPAEQSIWSADNI